MEAYATVDTRALAHNLTVVRQHAPNCRVTAVIKADGYGHGLETVAQALRAADGYAVARLHEALRLRDAGLAHPILLLEGVFAADDLAQAFKYHLDVVVHSEEQVSLLESCRDGGHINVWLKVDTGMGRLGIDPAASSHYLERLDGCRVVTTPVRMMSHLASADDVAGAATQRQLDTFAALEGGVLNHVSLANSAALLHWPAAVRVPTGGSNWVRPGLMLYGVAPTAGARGADIGLRPAMRFATRLIAVKDVAAGAAIGYGGTWSAPEATVIATAAAGYGDGYPWPGSGLPVLVNGERATTVGRVSMDMLAIDVGAIARPRVGDEVVLWGGGLPVEEVAEAAGTIPYTLLCATTNRVRRETI